MSKRPKIRYTLNYMLKQEDGSYKGLTGPSASVEFINVAPPIPRVGETVRTPDDIGMVVDDVAYSYFEADPEFEDHNFPWVDIDLYLSDFPEDA